MQQNLKSLGGESEDGIWLFPVVGFVLIIKPTRCTNFSNLFLE